MTEKQTEIVGFLRGHFQNNLLALETHQPNYSAPHHFSPSLLPMRRKTWFCFGTVSTVVK
jgi:hypothetical protein